MASDQRNNYRGYLFVAPAALYLALFSLLPVAVAGFLSLHRWHLLKDDRPFVGLANYLHLVADPLFRNAVYNTVLYTAATVPLGVVTALVVAMLVVPRGWAVPLPPAWRIPPPSSRPMCRPPGSGPTAGPRTTRSSTSAAPSTARPDASWAPNSTVPATMR